MRQGGDGLLTAVGLSKRLGDQPVLRGVGLALSQGEAVVVIGPSGSGKTTLLKCLNLLHEFEEGVLSFRGERVAAATEGEDFQYYCDPCVYRRSVGMVFQDVLLWPNSTVLANVSAGLRYSLRWSKHRAFEKARSLCESFGLGTKVDRYPHQLSGGEKQRTAIARAVAMEPDVLLLDEVTSNLDPSLVGEVLDFVAMLKDRSRGLVLVTHHIEFARQVADRMCFLDTGEIVEEGLPTDLLDAPRDERLLAFLGRLHRAY